MAAPSSQILDNIRLHEHFYGSTPMWYGTAGGTIAEGDVLSWSSGLLVKSSNHDIAALVGVALAAGTAAAAQTIPFIPFWPGTVWEITLDNSSTTGATLAQANIGVGYALGLDAGNGKFYVDTADTTDVALKIIGARADVVVATTTYPRVYVVPVSTKMSWGVTS